MKFFKNKKKVSMYLMYGVALAITFAVVGWVWRDIWLASTQWLLIAAVLLLFGLYTKK